jgi:hypothetical protein
MQILEVPKKP